MSTPSPPPRLSVVVPIHNEADFLPIGLPDLLAAAEAAAPTVEVIVVENGSSDGSAAIARQVAGDRATVVSLPEADYGSALRAGFIQAQGEWVINFDIDYYSKDFLEQVMETDADLVIGSKRDPRSDDARPPLRRAATLVFNLLLTVLFRSSVSDTHGMKGFRREVVARLVPEVVSRQDLFDTELVLRAERAGYRIVEVPVVVRELRDARSSLLRRVPRTLRGLLRVRRLLG